MANVRYMVRFGSDDPATYTGLSPTFTKFFNSAGTATTAPGISEIASSGMYSFQYEPTGFIGFLIDGTASMASGIRYVAGVLDENDRNYEMGTTFIAFGTSLSAVGASLTAQGNTISVIGASISVMGGSLSVMGGSLSVMGGTLIVMGDTLTAIGAGSFVGSSLTSMGDTLAGIAATLIGVGNSIFAMGTSMTAGASLVGSAADTFGDSGTDPTTMFGYLKRLQEFNEGDSLYVKGTGVLTMSSRGSSAALASKTITDGSSAVAKT